MACDRGLIVLLILIKQCTSQSGTAPADRLATDAQQAITAAVQTQSPPPVQPLNRSAVARGLAHARLTASEGLAGAMIYSQNCYDALGRSFSWAKLDSCGAFYAEAALTADEEDMADRVTEAAWFQSETAAGRFLKAAAAAGASSDDTDARWSELQRRVAGKHKNKVPDPSSALSSDSEPVDVDDGNDERMPGVQAAA